MNTLLRCLWRSPQEEYASLLSNESTCDPCGCRTWWENKEIQVFKGVQLALCFMGIGGICLVAYEILLSGDNLLQSAPVVAIGLTCYIINCCAAGCMWRNNAAAETRKAREAIEKKNEIQKKQNEIQKGLRQDVTNLTQKVSEANKETNEWGEKIHGTCLETTETQNSLNDNLQETNAKLGKLTIVIQKNTEAKEKDSNYSTSSPLQAESAQNPNSAHQELISYADQVKDKYK